MKKIIFLLVLMLFSGSCTQKETALQSQEPTVNSVSEDTTSTLKQLPEAESQNVISLSIQILNLLQKEQYDKFIGFIHPEKGMRFSMYAHVDPQKNKVFSREDFQKYINSNIRFTFGEKDGTGEKYVISLGKYIQEWVLKRDFSKAELLHNTFKGEGNSLNNLKEIYPNSEFTEFYISGTEQYGGMDWNALRLVFEKFEGKYYLVAIINDQWTI